MSVSGGRAPASSSGASTPPPSGSSSASSSLAPATAPAGRSRGSSLSKSHGPSPRSDRSGAVSVTPFAQRLAAYSEETGSASGEPTQTASRGRTGSLSVAPHSSSPVPVHQVANSTGHTPSTTPAPDGSIQSTRHHTVVSSAPVSLNNSSSSASGAPSSPRSAGVPFHTRSTQSSVFQQLSDSSKLRFSITSTVPVHSASEKEFTAFLVTIISPQSEDGEEPRTILRRYRQFAALHASISKAYPDAELPSFPKKRLIGNMSQQVVEKRRRKLEIWLQHASRLPNVEDLLGFITFLGGDLSQRGAVPKKKGHTGSQSSATGVAPGTSPAAGSGSLGSSSGSAFSALTDGIDDSYKETEKEKEQRVAAERRYHEVKYFVSRLDACIFKLEAVELAFEDVYQTSDFVVHSEYSKLVVVLGKYLGPRALSPDFVPRELSKEKEDAITNVRIRAIRQKIIPAISELISKLRDIKDALLDVTFPMDRVLELTHIIDDVQEIFDESNLVPKALGFRIESGATHYEAMRERWSDYIENNIYHYRAKFAGSDHVIAYTALDGSGSSSSSSSSGSSAANGGNAGPAGGVCVAIKPLKFHDENHGDFAMFMCTRDGNDYLIAKVHLPRVQAEWRERVAEVLTTADARLRGVDWNFCAPADGESLLLAHEKRDMRITRRLKFGILLCLKDQEKEEDMFGNFTSTPAFDHFLEGMGHKVELSGYQGFAGGLDTRGTNSTGTHSYVHDWPGVGQSGSFQLMYHVSTLLPHGEADQNLAKKRHIGNDIVAIVFQEDGSKPFQATTIKSNYLQIIIVVRSINLGDGKYAWRVTVSNAQDVPEYGPPLPYPPIFTDRSVLCDWLIHKMINGELAAYRGKLFIQQFRTTWKTLVGDLISQLPQKSKDKKSSKSSSKKDSKKK